MRARLHSAANRYYLKVKDDRKAWRSEQPQCCMWCGSGDGPLDVHEVCRKSQAQGRWGHRCNYLLVGSGLSPCNCHERVFATMPFALQLFVKMRRDFKSFSLEEWIRIRNRGPEEITMKDILEAGRNISLPALRPKNSLKF